MLGALFIVCQMCYHKKMLTILFHVMFCAKLYIQEHKLGHLRAQIELKCSQITSLSGHIINSRVLIKLKLTMLSNDYKLSIHNPDKQKS